MYLWFFKVFFLVSLGSADEVNSNHLATCDTTGAAGAAALAGIALLLITV